MSEPSALFFHPPGQIRRGPCPPPALIKGQVLIAATTSAVSPGTELRCLRGQQPGFENRPFVPGYAAVGRVVESLDPQTHTGQRVVIRGSVPTPGINLGWGGHRSHHVCVASALVAIPDRVSDEQAVLARLLAIPQRGLTMAQPTRGDRAVVLGLGIIGLGSALLLRAAGADVLCIDRSNARIALAESMGLHAIATDNIAHASHRHFPDGATLISDATGAPAVVGPALDALQRLPWNDQQPPAHSRYIVQGSYTNALNIPYDNAFQAQATMLFPRDYRREDLLDVLHLLDTRRLDIDTLITTSHGPDDAEHVYAQLADPQHAAPTALFKWSHPTRQQDAAPS